MGGDDIGGNGGLLYEQETFAIRRAIYEVSRELGVGFLEAVYQEALAIEFAASNIPFEAFPKLEISYKGQPLIQGYQPDFVCFGRIIVELKALSALTSAHRGQTLNYLKATGLRVALLVNFGVQPKAIIERIVM